MARETNKIRVGLIGCNKRALWYGAIFDDINPHIYAALDPGAYHHMTSYYKNDAELHIKRASGFELTKVYDYDTEASQRIAGAFRTNPIVCRELDEVSTGVDLIFITNESGDGGDHLELARPGILKGVPTFVDRPLALTVKQARVMISLARRKRTPLFSCSHMRMLPQVEWFRLRFPETGCIEQGVVQGHGPNWADIADGIELAISLFGGKSRGDVESVWSMGSWPLEIMHMLFSKENDKLLFSGEQVKCRFESLVINSHTSTTRNAFWAKAIGYRGQINSSDFDAVIHSEGGLGVMNTIREMVRTGKPPLPYSQLIQTVAVMQAGRHAHNQPQPANVMKL